MKNSVTDDHLLQLAKKTHEILERAKCGVYESMEEVLGAFQVVIEGKIPVAPALTAVEKFAKWRTFLIGGVTKDVLLQRIESSSSIAKWAKDMMKQPGFTTQDTEEEIETIILTPDDFGFGRTLATNELFDPMRLYEWSNQNVARLPKGYVVELLPGEAGPHIRDQYKDQLKGEVLWIAMEPIIDSSGGSGVFSIYWGIFGVQWLSSVFVRPEEQWFNSSRILFRLRKVA